MTLALVVIGSFAAGCWVSWHMTNEAWYRALERHFEREFPADDWQRYFKAFISAVARIKPAPPPR